MAFSNLGILAPGTPAASELLQAGTTWTLLAPLPCYGRCKGLGLATEAAAGRQLTVTGADPAGAGRLRVRLVEDGYPSWIDPAQLLGRALASRPRPHRFLTAAAIRARLASVLAFAEAARQRPNRYLWGGSLGPDRPSLSVGFVEKDARHLTLPQRGRHRFLLTCRLSGGAHGPDALREGVVPWAARPLNQLGRSG